MMVYDGLWWLVELVVLLMLDILRTTSATDGQQFYLLVLPISRTSSATYASSATDWQQCYLLVLPISWSFVFFLYVLVLMHIN